MEDIERPVAGLFGRTVTEILDLAQKEKHDFSQIIIVGIRRDGSVKSFKTRMPFRDMALISKMIDATLISEMNETSESQ